MRMRMLWIIDHLSIYLNYESGMRAVSYCVVLDRNISLISLLNHAFVHNSTSVPRHVSGSILT